MELTTPATAPGVHAGKVDAFELDCFRIVETGTASVGVVRTRDGFFAVLNRCPHMGAPICIGSKVGPTMQPSRPFEFRLDHDPVVRCPWHRWEFRLRTGESVGNTTRGRLPSFRVHVVGDDVFVDPRPQRVSAENKA